MEMMEEDYLAHYGILRKSGRYPWGSGSTPSQRNKMFLDTVRELKRQGMTDAEVARSFSTDAHPFTSTMLVDLRSIAVNQQRQEKINQVVRLKEKGLSDTAIGKRMGINESSVRSLKAASEKRDANELQATSDMLRRQVDEKGAIDIGTQVERDLPIGNNPEARIGISRDKFRAAVTNLKEQGYKTHTVKIDQLGNPGNRTTIKVLAKPDVKWVDLKNDPARIKPIVEWSEDGGNSYQGLGPLKSVSSKRLAIKYAEDGGAKADGVVYLRRGVKDLDMGAAQYAQVRIPVDGTHYIKGMAIYRDDLPAGVDMVFHTNKSNTGNKLDALKEMNTLDDGKTINKDNPFGAVIPPGGRKGALNRVYAEGDWDTWSRTLPSQMLSKQTPRLIENQLAVTHERRVKEFGDLKALTNPTIKKKLIDTFAEETDSAAVHLKAANMPHQATKVLLPVPSVKPTEVYAPSFRHGESVALIRYPHGGTFEIPVLTVNNRNQEAKKLLGPQAKDAVGIHHKVAERLSGADFDGDTVVVIPNNRREITSTPALEGLKGFDPKKSHPPYDGMPTVDGGKYNAKTGKVDYGRDKEGNPKKPNNHMQKQMGDVSNLITDMTIQGASTQELAQAVRHSMVVIDSEKHVLDYKGSATANGIPALKEKYQSGKNKGAYTLLSKAGSPVNLEKRKPRPAAEGGPIDRKTGQKKFVETGEHYINSKGQKVFLTEKHERLAVTEDAHTLSSGTRQEHLYADYSNKLKAMANEARKESLRTPNLVRKSSAAKVYKDQVNSLNKQLDIALRNAPRERQAQAVANSIVNQTKAANPHMDKDDLKKTRIRALQESRLRTGANKDRVDITPDEWEAIQAGAISNKKLTDILNNSNLETVRALATPRGHRLMTNTMASRARGMIAMGYTQREIADQLGVSLSTLKEGLA